MIPVFAVITDAASAVDELIDKIDLLTWLPVILGLAAVVFAIFLGKRIFTRLAK